MNNTIGIVGLGLIGGSIAKSLAKHRRIIGFDNNAAVMDAAVASGVVTRGEIGECDIVIIALYPRDTLQFIEKQAKNFKKGAIIVDCCGIKQHICDKASLIAQQNGFKFIGGHPMAGTEKSGFSASFAKLFEDAHMILCPCGLTNNSDEEMLKNLFISMGFAHITICTPAEHDRVIAYTSQLAHILSSAYLKSGGDIDPTGFSAGSYKDLTRVAGMNRTLWSQLFADNSHSLCDAIDRFIEQAVAYRDAIKQGDITQIDRLIQEGNRMKEGF